MTTPADTRLLDALNWALGCGGEFPSRQDGQGAYWWRTELAARAGLTYDKDAGQFVRITEAVTVGEVRVCAPLSPSVAGHDTHCHRAGGCIRAFEDDTCGEAGQCSVILDIEAALAKAEIHP